MTRVVAGGLLIVLAIAGCRQSPPSSGSAPAPAAAPAPAPVVTPPAASAPAPAEPRPEPSGPRGTIKGKTVWPYVGDYRMNLTILLVGDDAFTTGQVVRIPTKLGEPYSAWVPAGSYVLKARVGAVRLWEMRVSVAPESETVVDLTPADSPVSPDKWPPRD